MAQQLLSTKMFELSVGAHVQKVTLETVHLHNVRKLDRKRFNSHNHWPLDSKGVGKCPSDYYQVLSDCNACHWMPLRDAKCLAVLDVPAQELPWLKRAAASGRITAKPPVAFEEELADLAQRLEAQFAFAPTGSFVRTENVSLKCGLHGKGPYNNWRHVLESCVTSTGGHDPVGDEVNLLRFYVIPWVAIAREFRVFVYQQQVVAVSQQDLYNVSQPWETEEFASVASGLLTFCNDVVARIHKAHSKTWHPTNYVLDVGLISQPQEGKEPGQHSFYMIEMNPYGAAYSSGSALFHWLEDEEVLRGACKSIPFRFTVA